MKIIGAPGDVKLCHLTPGEVVQVGEASRLFIVAVRNPTRTNRRGDLYGETGELFLVGLDNGIAHDIPHLSSCVRRRDDVVLVAARDVAA